MEATAAVTSACSVIEDLVRHFASSGTVSGHWNLSVERPTIGGLLLLRQELEQLAELSGAASIELKFAGSGSQFSIPQIAKDAFASRFPTALSVGEPPEKAWPPQPAMHAPGFSYQFFDRISALARMLGRPPILQWAPGVLEAARKLRLEKRNVVVVHMKNVPGQGELDSNAIFPNWARFLRSHAKAGQLEFLLIGADAIPENILAIAGVHSAQRENVPLGVQLAMAPVCSGFMGMASGLCPGAVLSDAPYVLFKHPRHHVDEMERELGQKDAFPFARERQFVWRMAHTEDMLGRALGVVLGNGA
jgi:hypothetical protein